MEYWFTLSRSLTLTELKTLRSFLMGADRTPRDRLAVRLNDCRLGLRYKSDINRTYAKLAEFNVTMVERWSKMEE